MENDTPASVQPGQSVQPDVNELQAQCLWLRKQVINILVLMIVVSGVFNIYLWRQGKQRRAELDVVRPQVAPMIAEYNQMAPRMDEFVKKITEYGTKHSDFGPIMAKYGLVNAAATGAAPATPAAAPAAPAAPAPKK